MNPLVIAVDTGNKNIKTPHTEPFNSGLICHGAIPPAVKSDTLLFDGNYYTLTQSRIPYMYNKTTDWSYYVLTLIAIAKEMMAMGYVRPGQKQVKQDVCLAMGLPPTHIHDLASEYDKYFGRDGRRVVFTYNNVDFEIRIVRVMVFPQGVAAIAPYMSKIMARPEAYTYIIDIGGYTTDVAMMPRYITPQSTIFGSQPAFCHHFIANRVGARVVDEEIIITTEFALNDRTHQDRAAADEHGIR